MNLRVNSINFDKHVYAKIKTPKSTTLPVKTSYSASNINFSGKRKENNPDLNLKNLIEYFRKNPDVYFKPIYEDRNSGQKVIDLALFDYEKTIGMLEVVKNNIRGQIIKNGKVAFEDEYLTNLSGIKTAVSAKKLTPKAFSELIEIASNRERSPKLDVFSTINALETYDFLKNTKGVSFGDFTSVCNSALKDSALLTKNEVDSLSENSDLLRYEFVKDLRKENSKDDVLSKLVDQYSKGKTVFIDFPYIYNVFALAKKMKENNSDADSKTVEKYDNENDDETVFSSPEDIEADKHIKRKMEQIRLEIGTKVAEIPKEDYIPEFQSDLIDDIYDELKRWQNAGKKEFLTPFYIDILDYGNLMPPAAELRYELTGAHDLKQGKNIHLTNSFGMSDENAVKSILNERIYQEEFECAGIPEDLINLAHTNTTEFISVASMGNISDYSDEFKQVLVDFGMPEWELKLGDLD